jgi:hypothetical protein
MLLMIVTCLERAGIKKDPLMLFVFEVIKYSVKPNTVILRTN